MTHEDNPRVRVEGQAEEPLRQDSITIDPRNSEQSGIDEAADGTPNTLAKTGERSIDVVFDLADPDQARSLQGFRSAFGEDHAEVESLGRGKVVLKLYPGGAGRLP
jgi:hypothetical protein